MKFHRHAFTAALCGLALATGLAAAGEQAPPDRLSQGPGGRAIPLLTIFGSSQGPKFEERAAPEYPFAAKKRGEEGTVVLRLTIDELGMLQGVDVVSATDPVFIDAAVASVKKSFFIPAKSNHRPVASQAILPIQFRLKKQ